MLNGKGGENSFGSRHGLMVDPCEYSNKPLDFMTDGEFLEQLSKEGL
jgi:hypothetical protein